MFDNAFRFLEKTFAQSQEMVMFVTEITAGYDTSWFVENFGCDPADIRAAIGPNIGQCHFETDRDVPDAALATFGAAAEPYIRKAGAKYYVNLKEINALILRRAGVRNITVSDACTMCDPDRFWSHRVTKGDRGSQGAVITCREVEV